MFSRQKHQRRRKLRSHWRWPAGIHSKMREQRKGHPKSVEPGFAKQDTKKGLHFSGKKLVVVNSPSEVAAHKNCILIVPKNLGWVRKKAIYEAAITANLPILNVKDPKKVLEAKAPKKVVKEEKKEAPAKKKPVKKVEEVKEEKKEHDKKDEKKEHDKILTNRRTKA